RFEGLRELRRLKPRSVDAVMEQRNGSENRRNGEHRGQGGAENGVEAARFDIALLHTFVYDRALLKEKHPRRHRSARGSENEHENFVPIAGGQRRPSDKRVAHGRPIRMRKNRRGKKQAIKNRKAHDGSFPSPITAGGDCRDPDQERPADCNSRPDAEKTEAGANSDEFRHEGQEISDHQISHREETPEASEAVEDELGMPPMRDGTQPNGHFLHDETHDKGKHDEREKKADAKACAVRRIRKHAGRVVLAKKDENARSDQKPKDANPPRRS